MALRLTSSCCLLLMLAGCHRAEKKPPMFQWTGRWEKTDLVGSYQSYIRLDDGRVASIGIIDAPALKIAFTREPGNLLRWTPSAELMRFEVITDLPDPVDPTTPATDRFMTRPTVVSLPDGDFLGLGMICRDYPPVDGLAYMASYSGTAESVRLLKEALLAGQKPPKTPSWNYWGKVKGPVGEYLEKQVANSVYVDTSSLIHQPDGPAVPDHARPTRNRFLAVTDNLGSRDPKKDAWLWTVLIYSADGREWFFAKDSTGAARNLTPGFGDQRGYAFPFVFRHAADEWWMWRSGDFQGEESLANKSHGIQEIFLYYSPDGLNWQFVSRDVVSTDFPGRNGKPLGLKNMLIYYDTREKQIHGLLSVRDEDGKGWWRKYHNIARVTRK